jgi:hypothetical protein
MTSLTWGKRWSYKHKFVLGGGNQIVRTDWREVEFKIFAIVDALTRLAGQVEYAGDRTALDVQAASLLALAA